jgi:hypothetical protein
VHLIGANFCSFLGNSTKPKFNHAKRCQRGKLKYLPAILNKHAKYFKHNLKEDVIIVNGQMKNIVRSKNIHLGVVQFHNPTIVALKNMHISPNGYIYNEKFLFNPNSCSSAIFQPVSERIHNVSKVFILSSPYSEDVGDQKSLDFILMDVLPRVSAFLSELDQYSDILIHYNGGDFLPRMLEFLRLWNIRSRFISGQVFAKEIYMPEPSLDCRTPGSWQGSEIQSLIGRKLIDYQLVDHTKLNQHESTERFEILIIQDSGSGSTISNINKILKMTRDLFPSLTLRILDLGTSNEITDIFAAIYSARMLIVPTEVPFSYLLAARPGTLVLEVMRFDSKNFDYHNSLVAQSLRLDWYGVALELDGKIELKVIYGLYLKMYINNKL